MYKLCPNKTMDNGDVIVPNCIKRIADEALIPKDPDNTDYQAYLKHIAEGGVVLPADEVTQ